MLLKSKVAMVVLTLVLAAIPLVPAQAHHRGRAVN